MLPPPIRSPLSGTTNAAERDVYGNSTAYLPRNPLSPSVQYGYPAFPDPSRTVLSATAGLSLTNGSSHYPAHMAHNSAQYGTQANESVNFPWPTLEVLSDLSCDGGQQVTPEIHAKVEKGFFLSTGDQKWTCYRRNYFSVNCSFELHNTLNNGRIYLARNNSSSTKEPIQALGMRLSAAVDGSTGKNIELIQHTPKRDNGPKSKIEVTKVSPSPTNGRNDHTVSPHGVYQIPMPTFHATGQVPGPLLPLQYTSDDSSPTHTPATPALTSQYGNYGAAAATHIPAPGSSTTHTFERVQFKQATANNGKRRASQQYFHLILELFADVRKDDSDTAVWVKIAQRVSDKIVVRGRSPSHYQHENGHNGAGGRAGATGGGGTYSTVAGAASYGMNAGGFRTATSHYGGMGGGSNGYRAHYGLTSPGSHSGSSGSSIDGAYVDADYPVDTVMSDAERMAIHEHDDYQYYPSTIYEGMTQGTGLPPLGKIESNARYSTEPRQYAVKAEYTDAPPRTQFATGSIGRFQGVDSSRGYYPTTEMGYS